MPNSEGALISKVRLITREYGTSRGISCKDTTRFLGSGENCCQK